MTHVLALCGGVGGAKLAFGLARRLDPTELTIVVNTGDDFEHLGLTISPDLDTVAYTLAGLSDRERGWGLAGETWNFMDSLRRLGGEDWFQLGDQDLAIHVERTRRMAIGQALSQVTRDLTAALGIRHAIAPMSDQPVRTMVDTRDGEMAFQRYFVAERCQPVVRAVRYLGAEQARPSPGFQDALARDDLEAVILCPSNPYLSIDPILSLPGVRTALQRSNARVVAVSPIVGGAAIKGPTAKLMRELGVEPSVMAVARHYDGLLDGMIIDPVDAGSGADLAALGVEPMVTAAVMRSDEDRVRLAGQAVSMALRLQRRRPLSA